MRNISVTTRNDSPKNWLKKKIHAWVERHTFRESVVVSGTNQFGESVQEELELIRRNWFFSFIAYMFLLPKPKTITETKFS